MGLGKTICICITILFVVLCISAAVVASVQKAQPDEPIIERYNLCDKIFDRYYVVYVKEDISYRYYETYDIDTYVMYVIIESNGTYSIATIYESNGLPKTYIPINNDTPVIPAMEEHV
jgi:hypothetical protein